jgi:hypothetical protein
MDGGMRDYAFYPIDGYPSADIIHVIGPELDHPTGLRYDVRDLCVLPGLRSDDEQHVRLSTRSCLCEFTARILEEERSPLDLSGEVRGGGAQECEEGKHDGVPHDVTSMADRSVTCSFAIPDRDCWLAGVGLLNLRRT